MVIDGWRLCYEFLEEDNPLYIAKKEAYERNKLWHYTSFENLKKILKDKKLKFNRIDKVNDRLESKIFGDDKLSHLVYISCFSKQNVKAFLCGTFMAGTSMEFGSVFE